MPYDEDSGQKPDKGQKEHQEEQFSFLQETIKPKPVTRRKILTQLARIGIYGFIFGTFACLGFFALKPWAQSRLQGNPKTVTIPKDEDTQTEPDENGQPEEAQAPVLNADSLTEIMSSVNEIAKEAEKSVVSIQKADDNAVFSTEGSGTEGSSSGIIVADNGRELLLLCDSAICTDTDKWLVTFADNSVYEAGLKKQDKNSGLAVFAIPRTKISSDTWNHIQVAGLGNSNLVTKGDVVIALGNMFGYAEGMGYGIISSNEYQETLADGKRRVLATDIAASSGGTGMLFNLSGEVVGIVKSGIWGESGAGITKALAISDLKSVIELLVNGQSVPYVGIYGTTINDTTAKEQDMPAGIYVTQVRPDSPAMAAGIQSGDILQEISGERLSSVMSYEKAVLDCKVSEPVKIEGKRRGAGGYVDISFTVTVGSRE